MLPVAVVVVRVLLQCPPDRRLADVVLDRQLGHRLAGRVALGDLAALAGVELGRATEQRALGLGAGNAIVAALADQAALCRRTRSPCPLGELHLQRCAALAEIDRDDTGNECR